MCGPNIHAAVPLELVREIVMLEPAEVVPLVAESDYPVPSEIMATDRMRWKPLGFYFSPDLNSHHELMERNKSDWKPRHDKYETKIEMVRLGINPATGELASNNNQLAGFGKELLDEDRSWMRGRMEAIWDTHYPTLEKLGEWSKFAVSEIRDATYSVAMGLGTNAFALDEWEEGLSLLVHPRHKDAVISNARYAKSTMAPALKSWRSFFWQGITDHPNEYWRDRIAHPPVSVN